VSDHEKPSVGPKAVRKIILILYVICAVCVLLDFTYTKHGHYDFENIVGFHAVYGFVSCVLLVIAATQMRRFVKRDEDYYDD
jgi:phosphatidylserine synthase